MDEIHGPCLVVCEGDATIIAELGLHPPLWRLVAQLQAQFLVEAIDALGIHIPPFPPQQHMNAPIAVSHARLGDLLYSLFEVGLTAALRLVDIKRPINLERRTGSPDRRLPIRSNLVDKLTLAGRPHSFFESTSCNIALSRDRSATIRFNLAFSSSSCR